MTDAAQYERLARSHMTRQVREAASVQVALGRYWDRLIDPANLEASFEKFASVAAPLIGAGRARSELTAQSYYASVKQAAGAGSRLITPAKQPVGIVKTKFNLTAAADFAHARAEFGRGVDPRRVAATAKVKVLKSAKRRTLNAGRDRLVELAATDRDIRGWARVSDGSPCPFCAMLVSRGPVYSEHTVRFRAHDGCGCGARLVPRDDSSGGWDDESRKYRDLWKQSGGDSNEFRRLVEASRKGLPAAPKINPSPTVSPITDLPMLPAPERVSESILKSNPGQKASPDFQNNCHYVVAAVEFRARGFDVIARPTIAAKGRNVLQIAEDWRTPTGEVRRFTGLAETGARTTALRMAEVTKDWPVGARGYVAGAWKTGGGGHIFNVEKTADGLKFYEGQVLGSNANTYVGRMKPASVSVLRVDDLEPSPSLLAEAIEARTAERIGALERWITSGKRPKSDVDAELAAIDRKRAAVRAQIAEAQAKVNDPNLPLSEKLPATYRIRYFEKDISNLDALERRAKIALREAE